MTHRPDAPFSGPYLCSLSAREVVSRLKSGEVHWRELVDASETRTKQTDGAVNAMVTHTFDRARTKGEAQLASAQNQKNEAGWLAGLPLSIKDLSAVEGVKLTMGTPAMADYIASENDPIVDLVENKGGLVIGKTNTPEMGAGGNTFNAVFGQTRNPWDVRKNAGGSSGGAAVSLASGQVWLAQGSDLAGSLRTPAAYCGVVGLRPTPGVAFGGPLNLGFTGEGVSGPMARSVEDCALFLDAMAGYDERAPLSLPAPAKSYLQSVDEAEPDLRIAYAPTLNGFAPVESEIEGIMKAALHAVSAQGARVEEACPKLDGLYKTYVTLRGLFWATLPGRAPERVQWHYKRTLRENIDVGRNLSVDDIVDANLTRTTLYHSMRTFLHDYDVLACAVVGLEPTLAEQEYPREVAGEPMSDYIDWLRFSFLATATGLPAISVPCGFTKSGMPVGIQLIGPPRGDAKVLQAAAVIEKTLALGTAPIDPR